MYASPHCLRTSPTCLVRTAEVVDPAATTISAIEVEPWAFWASRPAPPSSLVSHPHNQQLSQPQSIAGKGSVQLAAHCQLSVSSQHKNP